MVFRYISRNSNCYSHHPISPCSTHGINMEVSNPWRYPKSSKLYSPFLYWSNRGFGDPRKYPSYPSWHIMALEPTPVLNMSQTRESSMPLPCPPPSQKAQSHPCRAAVSNAAWVDGLPFSIARCLKMDFIAHTFRYIQFSMGKRILFPWDFGAPDFLRYWIFQVTTDVLPDGAIVILFTGPCRSWWEHFAFMLRTK